MVMHILTWHRLGKSGLSVSGKTAAAAALAASQMVPLPSVGKKRKPKAAAGSPEPAMKSGKKRKLDSSAAEEATPSEPKTMAGRSHSKRPPKVPQEEADTPSGHAQRLKVRLGSATEVN